MTARNTSLDWLRAAAIIVVVNCHAASLFAPDDRLGWLRVGGHGVDLFFALSGWLIGTQVMRELRDTGTVNIPRFWVRRWLRTLPAYFAVLLFTYVWVASRGRADFDWRYLVFLQNYEPQMPYFGISWSLCVEEHFYLLVAPAAVLAYRWRTARVLLLLALFIPAICRNFGWYRSDVETHVVFDQCAAGVLLAAVSVFAPRAWDRLTRFAPLLAGLAVFAIGSQVIGRMDSSLAVPEMSRTGWLFACAALVLLANSSSFWVGQTSWWPARFVAERAYALYLTHVEALAVVHRLSDLPVGVRFALAWGLSFLFAEVLYRCVEKPGMRARKYWELTKERSSDVKLETRTVVVTP